MKKEIWEPVKGYEGLYEVSNFGRIKSIKFGKERILKPGTNRKGYLCVCLCKNGKKKNYLVHRLVVEAFIKIPEELKHLECTCYLQVNHKDENKQNNNVENLEFCDCKYNINFGTRNERRIKTISKPVVQYTLNGEFVREWKSAKQAEIEGGFRSDCICMCCKGKIKNHKGFIWKY